MSACPDEDVFVALLEARLDPERRRELEQHLDECRDCSGLVAQLQPPTEQPTEPPAESRLASATRERVGRYVITRTVGVGGTGVVYAAQDPGLDREVAIKTLRRGPLPPAVHAELLQREARALAQLAHESVAQVFDVGVEDGMVYVVMELVVGRTMRAWVEEDEPTVNEIVDAYCRAAEGLAAAHEAGLVHRDVKPTNIMRADDGSIRVLDFGFAAAMGGVASAPEDRSTIVGTVGYMAPEQWRNDPDERSDQFSFCAALFEALIGHRPFRQRGVPEGQPPGPRPSTVSRELDAVVRRGLALDPEQRWPSMRELRAALLAASRRRRRWPWIAAAGLAAGAAAFALPAGDRCEDGASALSTAWDSDARAGLQHTFESTGPLGTQTFTRVAPVLDDYVQRWATSFIHACETPNSATTDRALACLGRLESEFDAQLALLKSADSGLIPHAFEAVVELSEPEHCEPGAAALEAWADRDDALHLKLAELSVRVRSGDAEALLGEADALVEATRDSPNAVRAEAAYVVASIHLEAGRQKESIPHFEAAYFDAVEAGSTELQARAATDLLYLFGGLLNDAAEASRWAGHAAAALDDLPNDAALRVALENALGATALVAGEYEAARAHFEASISAAAGVGGDRERLRALAPRANLARVWFAQGRYDAAEETFDAAASDVRATLGDAHPKLVTLLIHRSAALRELGRYEASLSSVDAAVEVAKTALGPDHVELALAISNRCQVLLNMKPPRLDEAEQSCLQALGIRENALGPDHLQVGHTLTSLGIIYRLGARYDESVALLERARVVMSATLGDQHPDFAPLLFNLGETHAAAGDEEASHELFAAAHRIWTDAFGPDHPLTQRAARKLAPQEDSESDGPDGGGDRPPPGGSPRQRLP